jgi:hypothetical protein
VEETCGRWSEAYADVRRSCHGGSLLRFAEAMVLQPLARTTKSAILKWTDLSDPCC